MPRKPDLLDKLVGLEGRTIERAEVHMLISMGVRSLTLTFTDGTAMSVGLTKVSQGRYDALGITLPNPDEGTNR